MLESKEHNRFWSYAFFFRGGAGASGFAKALLLIFLLNLPGYALSGDKQAGETRYKKTCINCHGPAGKGVASYPKISGNDVSYTKLESMASTSSSSGHIGSPPLILWIGPALICALFRFYFEIPGTQSHAVKIRPLQKKHPDQMRF